MVHGATKAVLLDPRQTRTSSSSLVRAQLVPTRSWFPPSCDPRGPRQSAPSHSAACAAAAFVAPDSRMFLPLKVVVMRRLGNLSRLLSCADSCQSCAALMCSHEGSVFVQFLSNYSGNANGGKTTSTHVKKKKPTR